MPAPEPIANIIARLKAARADLAPAAAEDEALIPALRRIDQRLKDLDALQ